MMVIQEELNLLFLFLLMKQAVLRLKKPKQIKKFKISFI